MGVYFDYDFKNGKEVERSEKCFTCSKENILYAEYYILEGDVYKLYKDSKKIVRGKEIPVGSRIHTICDECIDKYSTEEEIVEKILKKRQEERVLQLKDELKTLQNQIEDKKQEIHIKEKELDVLNQELNELKEKSESLKEKLPS